MFYFFISPMMHFSLLLLLTLCSKLRSLNIYLKFPSFYVISKNKNIIIYIFSPIVHAVALRNKKAQYLLLSEKYLLMIHIIWF